MQPGQLYKPDAATSILLIGAPFSGKTNAAMCFPDPYILDADDKFKNAYERLPKDKVFWLDRSSVYDADPANKLVPAGMHGKPVALEHRWKWSTDCLKAAAVAPEPKTIIPDSLTSLSTYLMAHILAQPMEKGALNIAGERAMSQTEWTPFRNMMTKLIMTLKASGKLLVFPCHEENEYNEKGDTITEIVPAIPGQLKSSLAGLFTDVWRCERRTEIKVEGGKAVTVVKHIVRAAPLPKMKFLGTSIKTLPEEFEMSLETLRKYVLNGSTPQTQP